jgi:hypothetical protein
MGQDFAELYPIISSVHPGGSLVREPALKSRWILNLPPEITEFPIAGKNLPRGAAGHKHTE